VKVLKESDRKELARLNGIDEKEILELAKLSDLSRIKWVGVTFARMLYSVGIDTAEKASKANPVELHTMINQLNREKNIYKGQIGLNDIRIFVDAAKEVSFDIEY
jgi:ADP-dependent phosphofructokinase/glucokinase